MISIVAVGDIMPGGIISGKNCQYIDDSLLDSIKKADVRVGTLECAIGNDPTYAPEKMARSGDVIYAKESDLFRLKNLGIDIVSLANNHSFDLGSDKLIRSISLLDKMGIKHCGAGRNIKEAGAPAVFEKEGKSFAFFAFCDIKEINVGWCQYATETSPGINPMYEEYVLSTIMNNKSKFDYIVVMPHWGKEHTFVTQDYMFEMGRKMISAGADMVLGSHPHRIQPVVRQHGCVIAYSMGNFFFPDRLISPPRCSFYPDSPMDVSAMPVTERYPKVSQVTFKRWQPLARIGQIVSIVIDNGVVRYSTKYSVLQNNSVLCETSLPFNVLLILKWQSLCLHLNSYSLYSKLVSRCRSMIKRLFY